MVIFFLIKKNEFFSLHFTSLQKLDLILFAIIQYFSTCFGGTLTLKLSWTKKSSVLRYVNDHIFLKLITFCFQCDRKFYFKKTLIRHLKVDHGKEYKKFKCPEQGCNVYFRLKMVTFMSFISFFVNQLEFFEYFYQQSFLFSPIPGKAHEKTSYWNPPTWVQHRWWRVCLWKMRQKVPDIWNALKTHQGAFQI